MRFVGKFLVLFGALVFMNAPIFAASLTGTASVNVTSDTATNAKNMAFDEARRQIIRDVLSNYSDASSLNNAIKSEKSSALMNLISASSITGERLSDTTYSATIEMTVDRAAAQNWLNEHGIQNWIGREENIYDASQMVATFTNKVSDWAALRRTAVSAGIDLNTVMIEGNTMSFLVPVSKRGALTIALRNAGWQYQDRDGVLHIFK